MAMPLNTMATGIELGEFLAPKNRVRTSLLVDWEKGGIALNDPTEGLDVRIWEARLDENNIQVRPEGTEDAWTTVTSATGITELSIAFDQNMRPCVAYLAEGVVKLYWYDAVTASYITSTFPGAISPVVTLDDKRDMQIGLNDILFFYIVDRRVKHRLQRDRYTVEYDVGEMPAISTRIKRWGFTTAHRIQIEFD